MNTIRFSNNADLSDPPRSSPDDLDVRELEKRTRLMRIITRHIAVSELGNRDIARQSGIPVHKVSDLLAGRFEHLSIEELTQLRNMLESQTPVH